MPHDFMPGLAGIPAAKSAVSDVDGEHGILEYRGIRVEELCSRSSFLETSYLLLFCRLPTKSEMVQWEQDIIHHRRVKYSIIDLMKCLPEQGHPMDALQAAVAALGMFYPGRNVTDAENNYWSAVRLIAKLPTIVAAWARLRHGDDVIQPRDDLGFSENFFYMLTEKTPHPLWVDIFDDCMILHAEHTMNASTFTGLVTASTLADPYTVVASSIVGKPPSTTSPMPRLRLPFIPYSSLYDGPTRRRCIPPRTRRPSQPRRRARGQGKPHLGPASPRCGASCTWTSTRSTPRSRRWTAPNSAGSR